MPAAKHSNSLPRFVTLASFVLIIGVLRIAEDVMIPIALAFLLAFLLSPLVGRLTHWRLPRSIAIVVTTVFAFSVIGSAGWLISNQAVALISELPGYQNNLHKKMGAFRQPHASGTLSRAVNTIEQMWVDFQGKSPPSPTTTPADEQGARQATIPVEVKSTTRSSFDLARDVVASLIKPLGTAGIVIVFVIAILFQGEDLRSRVIRVVGGGQLNIATEALDDAARRVSSYLLAQLLVNTCFGLVIGIGLWGIGIPHAPLWGLLATTLRFIPFLGPIIAGTFPLVLAFAVDPGWTMLFWTAGLFVAAELVTNNVVEVMVYGTSTGISTLALLIAAVFWSWVWGLPGLFLSTPLTVCLLVIGQYVPGLKFLSVLLGSEPPLQPAARFYQSMLSMNQEDLFDVATDYVEQHSLAAFYDEVFVPALLMSEVDRHNGVLAEVRQKFIIESGRELIEELSARAYPSTNESGPERVNSSVNIVGFPARDEADELVAMMLGHLLRENGIRCEIISATAQPETYREKLEPKNAVTFISALPPSTLSGAGRVCRRIKQANSSAKVLVGVWSSEAKHEALKRRLDPAGVDDIVNRLAEAVLHLQNLTAGPPESRVPAKETESTRTEERTELKLVAGRPEEATDTVTRELARAFDIPVALVLVVETDRDFWRTFQATETTVPPAESSLYESLLTSDHPLVVEDVNKDERYSQNPLLEKRGVKFLASIPLRLRNGHHVGNLCILDTRPRAFGEKERGLLESLGAQLMDALEPETSAASPVAAAP